MNKFLNRDYLKKNVNGDTKPNHVVKRKQSLQIY